MSGRKRGRGGDVKAPAAAAYRELEERTERAAKMGRLLAQIDMERELLKPGRRVKVADATETTGAVFKWKTQRKK